MAATSRPATATAPAAHPLFHELFMTPPTAGDTRPRRRTTRKPLVRGIHPAATRTPRS